MNPIKGQIREDGFIFIGYRTRSGKKYERWSSPASHEKRKTGKMDRLKMWMQDNPEKVREQKKRARKRRQEKYPEKFKEKRRLYEQRRRARNPEKYREKRKKYIQENIHIRRARDSRKAKALRDATPKMPREDKKIIVVFKDCRKRVSECTGILFHVDHIIPISKGGLHIPSNIQILPSKINERKRDYLPGEFEYPV